LKRSRRRVERPTPKPRGRAVRDSSGFLVDGHLWGPADGWRRGFWWELFESRSHPARSCRARGVGAPPASPRQGSGSAHAPAGDGAYRKRARDASAQGGRARAPTPLARPGSVRTGRRCRGSWGARVFLGGACAGARGKANLRGRAAAARLDVEGSLTRLRFGAAFAAPPAFAAILGGVSGNDQLVFAAAQAREELGVTFGGGGCQQALELVPGTLLTQTAGGPAACSFGLELARRQ